MTHYIHNGDSWRVTSEAALDVHEFLPLGTYAVKFNEQFDYYYLEKVESFEITGKIYGNTLQHADRILNTFYSRPKSTGVMLSGEKGSGKTLLAQKLSLEAQEKGIPTILITEAWFGDTFNTFMQMIDQPTVVIFDEFEKVYDKKEQEQLLTLLDGVYPSKKLFILTCNDKLRVDTHMKNRPGRIFYRIDYTGLDQEFIREYCEDKLDNKEHIDALVRSSAAFGEFNFDILKALVEEMNRYQESPKEALALLNAKPEHSDASSYKVSLRVDGKAVPDDAVDADINGYSEDDLSWRGNPFTDEIRISYFTGDGEDRRWRTVQFTMDDLKKIDTDTGQFEFTNRSNASVTLNKVRPKVYDYTY